jgi:hypothetical protein
MRALLNHAERVEKGLILLLRTTALLLIALHMYLQSLKRGRHKLVEKKTLTAVLTVMTALLNHAERSE